MIDLAEVEHYRLSDADNRRTLRERIVPGLSASRVGKETPIVVFLIGRPGAGRSRSPKWWPGALIRHDRFADVDSDLRKPPRPTRQTAAPTTTTPALPPPPRPA
ncbi:hypothetical protein [Streptomyces scabiei]|uniref:hypothetical protein n=1 Tax=Streptomyces scabiei TaxID=1930 RepID=UPI001B3218D1|nr:MULTISPECIES: hypothetical protein [Streptomyces]MBP5922336.1 hypothetical protein [Streptomyces sp. LBUM 1483]MDX3218598.1 hypothetical protein [Streptomyces scabiei]MDX3296340.1 hypothetical protein [Streptomyces scabiei]